MLTIDHKEGFLRTISKIKDEAIKDRIKKLINKAIDNPNIGKPMRYGRKGTRELYLPPYRLAYAYLPEEDRIIFLEIYHNDEQ
ncbi:MAG: type II toxin-antitoxin system RelE/ParE family toxin [Nanoarchaeota archaeon]|nr:type II toxin-antitoxin system RelE/ParE family toxin [Nanoarchaeota archaeon]